MKHTPGPWTCTDGVNVIGANGRWIANTGPYGTGNPDCDENSANAHLIAAAPEMFDILKRLEWAIGDLNDDGSGKRQSCPMCDGYRFSGHMPDCDLAALLLKIEDDDD